MSNNNWSVLLIGGSSGIGKTRLSKELAKLYAKRRWKSTGF